MDSKEFNAQVDRLVETYGPRSYPKERIKGIWYAFKNYHHLDFRDGVDRIINECYHPPMLPRMREFVPRTRMVIERQVHPCDVCDSSGQVFAVNVDDANGPYYAFRCTCKNGEMFEKNFPLLDSMEGFMQIDEYYKKFPVKYTGERNPFWEKLYNDLCGDRSWEEGGDDDLELPM